jgi:hypothetical protein
MRIINYRDVLFFAHESIDFTQKLIPDKKEQAKTTERTKTG